MGRVKKKGADPLFSSYPLFFGGCLLDPSKKIQITPTDWYKVLNKWYKVVWKSGIQPHQSILIIYISNIMFARFLVMSIVLEPWAHNIVPANAQSKQSAANFKHVSSLLLHVYNLAVVSLTGIPLAQLRGVTSADGLLQSTDEGFQVMLRHCEDEWLQQLKSSIESWLKFIVQSVSPVLLGMSGEALP
jgi:hypothetical protein